MRNYKNYDVWKKSHELTLSVYESTLLFPNSEIYGLTSQLRRATSSIPTNIVEGTARDTDKDFRHFLIIANGSAAEVEYLLLLSKELNYINVDSYNNLNEQVIVVRKMLNKLITTLTKS